MFKEDELINLKGVIYKITNLVNNKVYIGLTTRTFNERYNGYGVGIERVFNSTHNGHLRRAIEKYGADNFTVEIVFHTNDYYELAKKEMELISKYNACNPKYGYNKSERIFEYEYKRYADYLKEAKQIEEEIISYPNSLCNKALLYKLNNLHKDFGNEELCFNSVQDLINNKSKKDKENIIELIKNSSDVKRYLNNLANNHNIELDVNNFIKDVFTKEFIFHNSWEWHGQHSSGMKDGRKYILLDLIIGVKEYEFGKPVTLTMNQICRLHSTIYEEDIFKKNAFKHNPMYCIIEWVN